MQLRDYQLQDIDTFTAQLDAGRRSIWSWHEQGLGKSVIAMRTVQAYANHVPDLKLLILGPSSAREAWPRELVKWAPELWERTLVVKAGKDIHKLTYGDRYRVVICTYDLCSQPKIREALRDFARGAFVLQDEHQYLRTYDSKRTQAAYRVTGEPGVLAEADRTLLMSGTPVVSWPMDLWAPVARFEWDRLRQADGSVMDPIQFRDRFHTTRPVQMPGMYKPQIRITGAQNEDELHDRIEGMAIRRLKTEVDLPPLNWQTFPISLSAADRKAMQDAVSENFPDHILRTMAAATRDPSNLELQDKLAAALAGYEDASAVIIRTLGVAKARATARMLKDELANGLTAVGVGSLNRSVLDIISEELQPFGVARVDGSTTPSRRTVEVDAFMREDGPRVWNGQIQACATAMTLIKASEVVMPQLSWTPGDNAQFASRFHRIGQTSTVNVRVPIVRDTIDEPLMGVLIKKTAAAGVIEALTA